MSSLNQAIRSRNALFLLFILGGVLAYLLYVLYVDASTGGSSWRQGDWLINSISEPARRGLFGSALLHTSDVLGLSPLLLLILFQALMVTAIFVVLGLAALDLKVPDKLLLIMLSPGFLIFFWFNDPQGSMRKELLAYFAFMPLIVAALRDRGAYLAYAVSTAVYAMSVVAHEGNVFLLPFLWVAMWIVLPPEASVGRRLALLAIPGVAAFGAGVYASIYTHVADTSVMCAQVVQRGLDPAICDGAIAFLETHPDQAHMDPTGLLSTWFRNFLLIYAACIVAFRVLFQGSERVELWCVAVIGSGAVFLPLYYLAGDYGRWLSMHVCSIVFLALIFLLKWRPSWLYEQPRRLDFAAILAMSLVIGIAHVPGVMIEGSLVKVARVIDTALE
jgi:hypothetical protein